MTRAPRISPQMAVVAVRVVLAVVNVVDVRVAHAPVVVGPVGAAGLTVIARLAGLGWRDLGLGPGSWRPGLKWAAVAIAVVAVVLAAAAAIPWSREAFRDTRYRLGLGGALTTALVSIPVGTVLVEEVAFRGVLWGLLRRIRGSAAATVASSALFGLWHVLPSLGLATDNQAVGAAVGSGGSAQAATATATVLFTAVAGAVFCELRRRSGSLLAAAGLHWATNALGVLAAAAVWAWGTR